MNIENIIKIIREVKVLLNHFKKDPDLKKEFLLD